MTNLPAPVNTTIAPLRNVTLLAQLVERVQSRKPGLPGMATFTGFSGYGKSVAAIYAQNRYRTYHVQVKSVWTRKKLCSAILQEMEIKPGATIPDMVDQIGEQLSLSGRALLIDEADILVTKGMIEVVRDIYESSQSSIILIGEENLPNSLKKWERVHGRMLDWVQAAPAALSDAKHLAKLYCPGIAIADDLISELHSKASGSVRRICVNLDRVREAAETSGKTTMTLADFPSDNLFTGVPPVGRRP
jgi:DNA transposition AAA+ family ATPase